MNMARDLGFLIPEIVAVITAVLALGSGMVRRPTWALVITVGGLALATALTIPMVGDDTTIFMDTYRVDDLSIWAKLIFFPTAALCAVLARAEVRGTDREATVYSLLTLATLGALALSAAGDIMFLILGLLLAGFSSFPLVAYPRNERSTEAAMKYFIFGAVSGAVMAFGLTYWFGATGSTLLADLGALDGMRLAGVAGLVGVLVGLGYKAGLAPLHFWVADSYDGAPVAIAAYVSIIPKIGALFALTQAVREIPLDVLDWRLAIAAIAAISMTYGNVVALLQSNLVRLLAYSSIAQAGYFLLGIVAIGSSDLAIRSMIVFGAAYAAMNLGAFAIVSHTGRELDRFNGLGRTSPLLGAVMVVFLLSLVGIPPMAGFFGKLLLFGAAVDAGYAWLAVVGILNSVLSLAVYLRIVAPMYYRQPDRAEPLAMSYATATVWAISFGVTFAITLALELFTSAGTI